MISDLYVSDLHIHSRFSRATSKNITFVELGAWASLKGIDLLGSGDILHPIWQQEFADTLEYDTNTGFYKPNSQTKQQIQAYLQNKGLMNILPNIAFVPTVETSHIYKDQGKVRKIHLVTIFKTLESAKKISDLLKQLGVNLHSDGRPIMGMSAYEYLSRLLETISADNFILVPAHVWTPWFSLFGSKSGYDDISDAFRDLTGYITALETGLSSDPKMNRLVPSLNKFLLVSNSDAHSSPKLAREANLHTKLQTIQDLFESHTTGKSLAGTLEFFPEEGKYHYDGHRKCQIQLHPKKTKQLKYICPNCKTRVTVGVLHRVYDLAEHAQISTTAQNNTPQTKKVIYNVPLIDLMTSAFAKNQPNKSIWALYFKLVDELGTELQILHTTPLARIQSVSPNVACAIEQLRNKTLTVIPGYDGQFGIVKVDPSKCQDNQLRLC